MSPSKIRWTNETWNPVVGCTKVSPGCDHCYAETLTKRFPKNFPNGFELTMYPDRLDKPLHWKQPRRIFVNSMSDLFHEKLPWGYIDRVFDVMEKADWHIYQILTKRPGIMLRYITEHYPSRNRLPGLPNYPLMPYHHIWLGTSVEDQARTPRIDVLRRVPVDIRFVSFEPLLGPISGLDLSGISWAIVGGESGPNYRPMDHEWARMLRDECLAQKVAFFYKQDSGPRTEMNPELDGRRWEEYPE